MAKTPKAKEGPADMGTEGHQGEPPVAGMYLGDMPDYPLYNLKEGQVLAEIARDETLSEPPEGEAETQPAPEPEADKDVPGV